MYAVAEALSAALGSQSGLLGTAGVCVYSSAWLTSVSLMLSVIAAWQPTQKVQVGRTAGAGRRRWAWLVLIDYVNNELWPGEEATALL
jgi:hypothetical protein